MALTDEVRKWLEEQGFPLEMRVAAAFRESGFEVRQSSHYLDPETSEDREIDVLATDANVLGVVDINFAAECKSTKKPWLLLSSPDTLRNYSRLFAFGVLSKDAKSVLAERPELMDFLPWLRKEGLVGYSLRQAFAERTDIAYKAAMSAAKACEYLVRPADTRCAAPFGFAFPVIVVNTPLIECSLLPSGELRLDEVAQGEFLFLARLPGYFGTCIRVVTAKHLPVFAREAKRAAELIREVLKPDEQRIIESWQER
ncbi:MAG: hypothetical protein AB1473_00770 [Thermodesulfobacteriota bacterium]